jgi:hypothetical protein
MNTQKAGRQTIARSPEKSSWPDHRQPVSFRLARSSKVEKTTILFEWQSAAFQKLPPEMGVAKPVRSLHFPYRF